MNAKEYLKSNKILGPIILGYKESKRKYKERKRLRNSCIKECYVREILMQQNNPNGFNRMDIIVRLIAIECEYGLNSYGWDLYEKMQNKRCVYDDKSTAERVKRFKELIASWKRRGYDEESLVEVDQNLKLIDGSHRMALSLFYGQEKINCRVYSEILEYEYGIDWFSDNGFSKSELQIISNKLRYVMDKYNLAKRR